MKNTASYLLVGCVNVVLLLLTLTGCVKDIPGNNVGTTGNEFAIYLVANVDSQNLYSLTNSNLSELELEDKPWLSLKDIDYYDSSSHYIYLEDRTFTLDVDTKKSFVKPFVVVASGERCYLGYFVSMASSFLPQAPYVHYPSFLADDVIAIENPISDGAIDMRNDPRIIEAFIKADKFNPGLRITLNEARVISRAEVVTMSYSFTITNESDDPIYVPDPDKMGSDLFHYYTNGLLLTKVENPHESVWASQKPTISLEPITKWDIDWFTRLGSHESFDRTVVLSGYPEFDNGVYSCQFTYSGLDWILIDERTLSDGRIWIGKVDSNVIEIVIEN